MTRHLLAAVALLAGLGVARAQDGGPTIAGPHANDGYWDVMNRGQTQSRFHSTYFTHPREFRNDRAAERAVRRQHPHLLVPRAWPANRYGMRRGLAARG